MFTSEMAQTIFTQMGGQGRLVAMIGAKNFSFSSADYYAAFKWVAKSKNKANYLKIHLNGKDLYDVEFGRVYGSKYTVKSTHNDVYAEDLINLFETETGLYLSL